MALGESDFGHLGDARLRRLLSYWLQAREDRPLPTTEAIDPIQFHYVLDLIWLCSVENDPRDFRYLIAGEHIRETVDAPMRGRSLRDITAPSSIDRVMGYFSAAVDLPALVHVKGRVYAEANKPAVGERILLPFADPTTGQVTRLLGATLHNWTERDLDLEPLPSRQVRTFSPVDGAPAWCEYWL